MAPSVPAAAVMPAPAADATGCPEITRDKFYQYSKHCGCRQVQKRYNEIAEQARSNNRSIAAEMKAQGFQDFKAFNKSCPPFKFTDSPMKFAELGVGAVLYFYFLRLFAVIFLVLWVIQIPIFVTYAGENWLMGWQWNTWTAAFVDSDPCRCIERNHGIHGLPKFPEHPDYGKSCRAWDSKNETGLVPCTGAPCANPGQWANRKWCFAGLDCPTKPNLQHPSLTNVHFCPDTSGTQHDCLVRAYSTCAPDENETFVSDSSTGNLSADVMFNETGAQFGVKSHIGSHWMTPGNFGPYLAAINWIPILYIVCTVVLAVLVLIGHQVMVRTDIKVDQSTISPNDFALMVRGLPRTATDEEKLMKWFSQNALCGRSADIVKIVIGWDVEEFRANTQQLKKLRMRLATLDPSDPEVQNIKKHMVDIIGALNSAAPGQASRLQSSGIIVVVFRHMEDMRECLNRFNTLWAQYYYCDACDVSFLWKGNRICPGNRLPFYPLGDQPACKITVERAANPGDINWVEIGVAWKQRLKIATRTNLAMLLAVVCTFFAVYGLNLLTDLIEVEKKRNADNTVNSYGFQGLALLPAFVVVLMNMLLQILARTLGKQEIHETISEEQFSQAWKMCLGQIANTAGVLLFLNATPKEWYRLGGLVDKAGVMLLTNVLIPPLIPLLDFKYRMKCWKRRRLTDEKLSNFNEVIRRVGPRPTTPDDARDLQAVLAQIEKFKADAFEPSEMDAPRRYADALKTIFCCLFFSPVLPMVSLLGFFGMVIHYAVGKYALARVYKRPERPSNASMAMDSLHVIKYSGPFAVALGSFIFLSPSWKDKNETWSMFTTSLIIAAVNFFFPMGLVGRAFRRCLGEITAGEMDYYKAQYMWPKEMKYHKDHFLYAKLPDRVNPEYLRPGTSAAVSLSDVRAGYTDAAASAADAAARGQPHRQLLPGGRVVESGGASLGTDAGAGGDAPAPAVYGVRSTRSIGGSTSGAITPSPILAEPPPVGRLAEPPPVAPSVVVAPTDVVPIGSVGDSPPVIWEFQIRNHWKQFAPDCHADIERKYQDHQAGRDKDRVIVTTTGITLSIDFDKMTQMKTDTHKVSAIRRRIG